MAEEAKITLQSIQHVPGAPEQIYIARFHAERSKNSLTADIQVYAETGEDVSSRAYHWFKRFLLEVASALPEKADEHPRAPQP